jgi:hypothetical protein
MEQEVLLFDCKLQGKSKPCFQGYGYGAGDFPGLPWMNWPPAAASVKGPSTVILKAKMR